VYTLRDSQRRTEAERERRTHTDRLSEVPRKSVGIHPSPNISQPLLEGERWCKQCSCICVCVRRHGNECEHVHVHVQVLFSEALPCESSSSSSRSRSSSIQTLNKSTWRPGAVRAQALRVPIETSLNLPSGGFKSCSDLAVICLWANFQLRINSHHSRTRTCTFEQEFFISQKHDCDTRT
jgi:hypothetical protein